MFCLFEQDFRACKAEGYPDVEQDGELELKGREGYGLHTHSSEDSTCYYGM
jgi:hypothetical protein